MPRITIDQHVMDIPADTTVLTAARQAGIDIPTLCHYDGFPAQNSCMVCVVKVNGATRLRPACSLPVSDGMVIESESDEVRAARRTALELLLSDHAGDCVAPCRNNCPANMDVPLMMRQIIDDDLPGAIATVKADIPLPAVLGYICPAPCEGGCRRKAGDGPVAVCLLKRFVAEQDLAAADPFLPDCAPATGGRIAIVGTGPTGLSAAYYLQLRGYACMLYDANDQPGGAMRYGIDRDLLPLHVLDGEIDIIRQLGASFFMNWRLGRDGSVHDLRREHEAVLLAIGAIDEQDGELNLPTTRRGVTVDGRTFQTHWPDVFAAGGAVRRTRLAVRSVAEGKAAAKCIDRYLAGHDPADVNPTVGVAMGRLEEQELVEFMLRASPDRRLTPAGGLQRGYNSDEARTEAARCLQCSCGGGCDCRIRQLATEYGCDLKRYRGTRRPYARVQREGGVVFEPGKCISCGLCVTIARQLGEPTGVTFVGRGFDIHLAAPDGASIAQGLGHAAQTCVLACPTSALQFDPSSQPVQITTSIPGAEPMP
ncbi:MAG: (2Fe-2S)-binding protein [Phycisphaeraceae bacterium]|nr:(2Fe-2S)-binding protein [Phycisphaeraceae bacterium]